MRYQDIFVPGGFPQHTYNPRNELQLEQRLAEANENLCKLVTVTGQAKSGKTVLTRRIFPPERSVWVDGGAIATEDDFWHLIAEQLGLFQTTGSQKSASTEWKLGGKGSTQLNLFVNKTQGEFNTEISEENTKATNESRTLSPRVTALRGLRERLAPLIIDDFHYLPKEMQGTIVRALKPLIFDGLPAVIIAIPTAATMH